MTQEEIENLFDALDKDQKIDLLSNFGHCLTICAREAYEVKGPKVEDPILLREVNEILHRVFISIRSVALGNDPNISLSHWISGVGSSEKTKQACKDAFKLALKRSDS